MIPPWGRGSGRSGVESTRSIIHKRSHVFDLCLAFGPSRPPPLFPIPPSCIPGPFFCPRKRKDSGASRLLASAALWLLTDRF